MLVLTQGFQGTGRPAGCPGTNRDWTSRCPFAPGQKNDMSLFIYTVIKGKLSGFIFQHIAQMTGKRWETPSPYAVKMIMNNPAQCLLDFAKKSYYRTMHVFLRGYTTTC